MTDAKTDAQTPGPPTTAPQLRFTPKHPILMATKQAFLTAALLLLVPPPLAAQSFLEQFSYEGLGFSGIGFELGPVASDRVTTELSGGVRVDYGMIAPRVRVVFGANYFKGQLDEEEILEFERRVLQVVQDPTGDAMVDIGGIAWTNVEATLDLQYVFPSGPRYFTYMGLGIGAHIRDGSGAAIEGTFVEDALDTIAASADLSLGVEIVLTDQVHFTTDVRGVLSSELIFASARAGFMYRINPGGG